MSFSFGCSEKTVDEVKSKLQIAIDADKARGAMTDAVAASILAHVDAGVAALPGDVERINVTCSGHIRGSNPGERHSGFSVAVNVQYVPPAPQ